MEKKIDPDSSMWDWLTYDLRFLCKKSDMSYAAFARLLKRSDSNVSNIMAGRRRIADRDATILDEHFDTGGHFRRLLRYARLGHDPNWFKQYISIEAEALVIKAYEALTVPGLLQVPEYARALFTAGGSTNVDALVEERIARQKIHDKDIPPLLWVLVTESVIDWPIGGPEVMRKQLAHLLDMSVNPHIGLRVIPRSAGAHAGVDGSFSLMSGEFGDVAYTESPGGGRLVQSINEIRSYAVRYDRIGQVALPERASRELIQEAMEAL
ncbi:DUF5753 domain-containing protein [Actinoallomurus sp. NPDC052274]|uniref:DUF5753 domain-containing protein n=1 Tax=Actinoallomurus sp. NPDC052274 TaxID=3155420 RepID=UPI0034409223